jgi:3-phenylpropionate/trans-cinnamate dioxygenase ferredoxin reductase subunit
MPETIRYLLLGGGTTCGYAADAIRSVDPSGSITIVSADTEPPYDRPPFSKGFLLKDEMTPDDAHCKDFSFYGEHGVELLLGRVATRLDPKAKAVHLEDGTELRYDKLLYALGSEHKTLKIPGGELALRLRSASDAITIRSQLSGARSAVVIGAGYLGTEVAATLARRGLSVTLLELKDRVWPLFPSAEAAEAIRRELVALGVELHVGDMEADILPGPPLKVRTVGGASVDGDLVIAAPGAMPRIELASSAGFAIGNYGVLADATLKSAEADVWVAGDAVEYPDEVLGTLFHAEHHLHAKWTGQHVGNCMVNGPEVYRRVPYFWSDVGDLSMILRGNPLPDQRSYVLGNPETPAFTQVFLKSDDSLAGIIDIRKDYKAQDPVSDLAEALMLQKVNLSVYLEKLTSPDFDFLVLQETLS